MERLFSDVKASWKFYDIFQIIKDTELLHVAICHFGIESLVTLFHYRNRRNNAPSLYLTVSEDFEERLDRECMS